MQATATAGVGCETAPELLDRNALRQCISSQVDDANEMLCVAIAHYHAVVAFTEFVQGEAACHRRRFAGRRETATSHSAAGMRHVSDLADPRMTPQLHSSHRIPQA